MQLKGITLSGISPIAEATFALGMCFHGIVRPVSPAFTHMCILKVDITLLGNKKS